APSSGEMQNMIPIEIALIRPTRLSARSDPTTDRTKREKFSDVTPIEKMTLARSYMIQLTTAFRGMTRAGSAAAVLLSVVAGAGAGAEDIVLRQSSKRVAERCGYAD